MPEGSGPMSLKSHPQTTAPAPATPPQSAPVPVPSPNGHPPRNLPATAAKRRKARRWPWLVALGVGLLALVGGFAAFPSARPYLAENFGSVFGAKRPDLILHKVKPEYLQVTVVERGTLESAVNMDLV